MQRHNKKPNKLKSKLSRIIGSSSKEPVILYRFFKNLDNREIYQSFAHISKIPYFQKAINLTLKNYVSNFYKSNTLLVETSKNFSWCLALIEFHAARLQKYNEIKEKLQFYVLEDKPTYALEALNEIDTICGKSMWSYTTRASIQSFLSDTKISDTDYFGEIKNNGFLHYVKFYSGTYFNDPEIYFTATSTHRNDIKRSANKDLIDFFNFKFFTIKTDENLEFENIFDVERNSSIVDIYELILYTLEYTKIRELDFENIFGTKINQILSVLKKTNCMNIGCFETAFDFDYDVSGFDNEYKLIDNYTQGKYEEAIHESLRNPFFHKDFSIVEIAAKSLSRKKLEIGDTFIGKIIKSMKSILTRDADYLSSLSFLSCLSNSFRSLEWFRQLSYFVERESNNIPFDKMSAADKGISFLSKIQSPRKNILFSNPNRYFEKLAEHYNSSSSLRLFCDDSIISTGNCDTERLEKYKASRLIKYSNLDEAEPVLSELIKSTDPITRIESLRTYSFVLMNLERFEQLINLMVDIAIDNEMIFSIFDTSTVLNNIDLKKYTSDKIELPILYILHSQYVGSEFDSSLKFAFETFLQKNHLRFPTDLFGMEEKFGAKKLYYFLKWVCTPESMKLYLEFDTYRDIEECRLKICNYLLSKEGKKDDLQFEIKNISKNLTIRKAVKQVENSRIYVDSTIYKGRNSAPYISLFERYLELSLKQERPSEDDIYFDSIISVLSLKSESHKDYWKSLSILFIPELKLSPKNATFLSIAKLMRQEFTYGEKGINNYLSTRIRHGVLPTAIRKSSVNEGIYVAQNESNLNELTDTMSRLHLHQADIEAFIVLAKAFSKKLEEEISIFNDIKLQIYTLESPLDKSIDSQGMFNYSISPIETYALQLELPPSPLYEDLVKVVTDWLWNRTDYILDDVKKYICNDLTENLEIIFDEFIENVKASSISQTGKRNLANAISRAKGDIVNDLNMISSWFEHVDADADGEFELNTAIEIARRSLDIELSLTEEFEYKISQRDVSNWVDVFFILFENAISKSKLKKSQIDIRLLIKKDENGIILIECSNFISEIEDLALANGNISFYRDAYGDEELTKDVIQREGGTGFFKIWKIFERDLSISHEIKFGYETTDLFKVSILLKM